MSEIEHVDNVAPMPRSTPPAVSPVAGLRDEIARMTEHAEALAEAGEWTELIVGLVPVQQVLGDLRELEKLVKQLIAKTIPEKRVTVEGVGTVERRKAATRKQWDSEELLRKIMVRALVDEQTGEVPSSPMVAVDIVMQEVLACVPITGSLGWRVTALKDRGFDPDEWCETTDNGWTVQVTRDRSDG